MRKFVFSLSMIIFALSAFANYITVTRGNENVEGIEYYAFYNDINIGLSEKIPVNTVLLAYAEYDPDEEYYLVKAGTKTVSSDAIYRDFENSIIISSADGFSYDRESELTRIHFDKPVYRKPDFGAITLSSKASMVDFSLIDSLSELIDYDSLRHTVRVISGDTNYASGYFNVSRFVTQPGCDTAANYLYDKFVDYGMDSVFFHQFTGNWTYTGDFTSNNVVALKKGKYPSNECIVVGAHYDGISEPYNDETSLSPAADDNGSGTAGVEEIARIIAGTDTDTDIYFVCFSGEEEGLYGSYYFLHDYLTNNGKTVKGMVNMDMIATTFGGYETNLYGMSHSDPLKQLFSDIADSITTVSCVIGGSSSGSDHYYFDIEGYKVVFAIERDFSTVYHSYRDSVSYMNFDFMRENIRAAFGTTYWIANSPSAVTGLALADNGDSSVTVQWTEAADADITGYNIYYSISGSGITDIQSAPVTDTWTLTSLMPDENYRIYVTAVDADGFEGFYEESDTITPSYRPHVSNINDIHSDSVNIYLSIDTNTAWDFSHYKILRKSTGDLTEIAQTGSTSFADTSLNDTLIYTYAVIAVDTGGLESDTSGIEQCRLITRQSSLLVIDETSNTTALTDAMSDAYYDSIFSGFSADIIDADSLAEIGILQLGNYARVVYIDDDLNLNKMDFSQMYDYVDNGGRIMIAGWNMGKKLMGNPDIFPAYTDTSDDIYKHFQADMYNRQSSNDLEYIDYDITGPDTIRFVEAKLPRGSYGRLIYGGIYGLTADAHVFGTFNSFSADSAFDGKPIFFANDDTTGIILNAPLYYMNTDDAKRAVSSAMALWGCYSGIGDYKKTAMRKFSIINNLKAPSVMLTGFMDERLSVDLYDITGRTIQTLFSGVVSSQSQSFSIGNVPSGIYFVRVKGDRIDQTGKLIKIK